MLDSIHINLDEDHADRLLDRLVEQGLPRELFEELADVFIEEYDKR